MSEHRAYCSKNSGPVEECHICNPKRRANSESAPATGLDPVLEERKRCADLCEKQRNKVLANHNDPSWTEHFAELMEAINSGQGV